MTFFQGAVVQLDVEVAWNVGLELVAEQTGRLARVNLGDVPFQPDARVHNDGRRGRGRVDSSGVAVLPDQLGRVGVGSARQALPYLRGAGPCLGPTDLLRGRHEDLAQLRPPASGCCPVARALSRSYT